MATRIIDYTTAFTHDGREHFNELQPIPSYPQWIERCIKQLALVEGTDYIRVMFPQRKRHNRVVYKITPEVHARLTDEATNYLNRKSVRKPTTKTESLFDSVFTGLPTMEVKRENLMGELDTTMPPEVEGEILDGELVESSVEAATLGQEVRDLIGLDIITDIKNKIDTIYNLLLAGRSSQPAPEKKFISVRDYAIELGTNMDLETMRNFGVVASKYCKTNNLPKQSRYDSRYGQVGMYPVEVLRKVGQEYGFV